MFHFNSVLKKHPFTERLSSFPAEVPGVFHHVIVNDDLEEAYQNLRTTVTQVRCPLLFLIWRLIPQLQEMGLDKSATTPDSASAEN